VDNRSDDPDDHPTSCPAERTVVRPLFAAGFVTAFGAHSVAANLGVAADLPRGLFGLGVAR
jgi:hypothetical protein